MNREIQLRLQWARLYEEAGDAGFVCRRGRISRPKGVRSLTLELRHLRNLGARRIQSELKRLHDISFSLATIHKALTKHQVKPVKKFRKKSEFIRYERPNTAIGGVPPRQLMASG